MIKSMTGYGKATAEFEGKTLSVEIRTLNSKQMDLSMRIPGIYRAKEYDFRTLSAKKIIRGKAEVNLNIQSDQEKASSSINSELFSLYLAQINKIAQNEGLNTASAEFQAAALSQVMRMPDVVAQGQNEISEQEYQVITDCFNEALDNLDKFREQEGEILMADLKERVAKIEEFRAKTIPLAAERVDKVKNRIIEAVEAAGVEVDHNRLEQEIVFYVEKLDVTEEHVRLKKHCEYFLAVASENEGVGRKLGFIAQEMGREINTLGSKANDAEIQRFVVQMKDELEKIKEQLLNIL